MRANVCLFLNKKILENLCKEINFLEFLLKKPYFSFLDSANAFLMSFKERDGPYIKTPPR